MQYLTSQYLFYQNNWSSRALMCPLVPTACLNPLVSPAHTHLSDPVVQRTSLPVCKLHALRPRQRSRVVCREGWLAARMQADGKDFSMQEPRQHIWLTRLVPCEGHYTSDTDRTEIEIVAVVPNSRMIVFCSFTLLLRYHIAPSDLH